MAEGFSDEGTSPEDGPEHVGTRVPRASREVQEHAEAIRQARILRAIHRLLQELRDYPDLTAMLERVCRFASEILGWRKVVITLRDHTALPQKMCIGASFGLDQQLREQLAEMARTQPVSEWRDERFKVSRSYFFDHKIDGGLAGQSNFLRTGAGVLSEDGWRDDDGLAVPIELKDIRFGALLVDDPVSGLRPSRAEVEYLEILADQAAAAIASDRLESQLRAKAREAEALYSASTLMVGYSDLSTVIANITDAIDEHFGHPISTIHLRIPGTDTLELKAFRGFVPSAVGARDEIGGPGIITRVARTGLAARVRDVREDPDYVSEIAATRSELVVPLVIDGEVAGVLNVESPLVDAFSESDERVLMSFAEQAALAINTAQLHDELKQKAQREALLNSIISAVHQTRDLDEILSIPCIGLSDALDVNRTYVALVDWNERVARFVHAHSKDGDAVFTGVFALESMPELSERLWRGEVVAVADVFKEEFLKPAWWSYERFHTRALMYVPVVRSDDWHAVLLLCARDVRYWTPDEIGFVETIAKQVGTAFLQAEYLEKERQLRTEWQLTFDTMSDGVLLLDREGAIRNANAAACALFRASREDVLALNCCDALADDADGRCLVHSVVSGRLRLRVQSTPRRVGRPTLITADAIASARGAVVVLRDLSDLRKAEAHARRQSAILSNLVANATELIAMLGIDGACNWINRSFANAVGIDEGMGRGLRLSSIMSVENWSEARKEFDRTLAGEPRLFETSLTTKNGADARILVTLTPIVDDTTLVGVLLIGRDVTVQRRAAERAAEADKLRALGQLSSGVAHNFNNALSVILGRTQLLMRKAKSEDILAELAIIERVSHEASSTVRRIQNFARRKLNESFSPVDLKALLAETVEMTSTKSHEDANAHGIDYDVALRLPEPDLYVPGIDSELREVFVNLIFNALDAMPSGGRLVIDASREGGFVVVSVRDSGTGMPEDVQRRIFEPFFTTKGTNGTGLGLAVSYGIVARHNGRIEFVSADGEGSTFTVFLPSLSTSIAASHLDRDLRRLAPLSRPCSVVVVDDDSTVCEVVTEALAGRGHDVRGVANAQEALNALEQQEADILVTDLSMPDMNGVALIGHVVSRWPSTRIVLMTGADVAGLDAPDFARPPDVTIAKPFELDELCFQVEQLAEAARSGRHE